MFGHERHNFLINSKSGLKHYFHQLAERYSKMYGISLDKLMEYIDENFDELAKSVTKSSGLYEPNSADSLWERSLLLKFNVPSEIRLIKTEVIHDDLPSMVDPKRRIGKSISAETFSCPNCNGLVVRPYHSKIGRCQSCGMRWNLE